MRASAPKWRYAHRVRFERWRAAPVGVAMGVRAGRGEVVDQAWGEGGNDMRVACADGHFPGRRMFSVKEGGQRLGAAVKR